MKKLFVLFFVVIVHSALAQTGNIIIPSGHAKSVTNIVVDKQGKYLYTQESNKVIMWDVKTHDQLYAFGVGGKQMILSNDGKKLILEGSCFSTVTGKFLFKMEGGGTTFAFSADDSKIYIIGSKLVVADVNTGKGDEVFKTPGLGYEINALVMEDGRLLVYDDSVWRIYNLLEKKIDFEYKAEYANTMVYLPNLHAMANYLSEKPTIIRDIYTGKVLKTLPHPEGRPMIIPSADNKEFIYYDGDMISSAYTVYNGETWLPVKKILNLKSMSSGYYNGGSGRLFVGDGVDINIVNTNTGAKTATFKRQVADLGGDIFSSLQYNYATKALNLVTDDSVYKSIDMVKLKPFRHKPIPNMSIMAFSSTGDTIAVFSDSKTLVLKNVKTGKPLLPLKKLLDEASTNERENFFFNDAGTELYYTLFSIPKQRCTIYRMNTKTGITVPLISFIGSKHPKLTPDKSMLAAIDMGYQYTHAKVWSVATGKLLFDKNLGEDYSSYISVSADKKQVLFARNGTPELYDIASGVLVKKFKVSLADQTIATTPDFSIFVTGGIGGGIVANTTDGPQIYEAIGHSEFVRRIFFSQDVSLMYTVAEDQTIKVWHTQTGKLLGTLYLFNDGNDYVFIEPYGRFDGTEGGMKRMYYLRNRVKVSLDVVYEKFYTPNLYQRLVNAEVFEPIDIIINPQPKARITYAQATRNLNVVEDKTPAYVNTTGVAEITVNASAENDKVDEIRLFHNGKILNLATRGLFVTDNNTGTDAKKYTLNLLPGVNNIRAVALNSQRTESEPDEITVNYNSGGQANISPTPNKGTNGTIDQVDRNATMHLIVVGINAYKNPKMSLNYALADATAFKDEAEKDAKTIISNLKTYFVTDGKADKNGIVAAFAEVQKNAKQQDVFVFYYAGHGVISEKNKEFYLVPNDVTDLKNVDEALAQNGIPSKMLQQYAIDIPAQKQVFILDACQSAGAFAQLMTNDANQQKSLAVVARSTGTHWIAASGSQQFAQEFAQLGHGGFTYVLLKAMQGEAASNKMITINGLKNFLQVQVPSLMKKYNGAPQYPSSYGNGNDFPVELMK
nr:caspase family protein [uncultured Mucilaginibacter sp.]